MKDIKTIFWKEWKEILFQPGGRSKYSLLVYIGLIGILFPMQHGERWLHSPADLGLSFLLPVFMSLSIIADSIAGERERHTLETLLASRLPDASILLGKIGVSVSYAFLITFVSLSLGVVTFYVTYSHFPDFSFSPVVIAMVFLISLLVTLFISCIGVLISLMASTVKQAQQTLSIGIVILLMVPILSFKMLPLDWKISLAKVFLGYDLKQTLLFLGILLLILDTLFVLYALSRFKRTKLILN